VGGMAQSTTGRPQSREANGVILSVKLKTWEPREPLVLESNGQRTWAGKVLILYSHPVFCLWIQSFPSADS
jgi:hypothetical protein